MFFKKCVFPFLAAAVCAAALFLPQFLGEEPLFAGAESYLFYAGSASSQAYIVPADAENAAAVRRSLFGRTARAPSMPARKTPSRRRRRTARASCFAKGRETSPTVIIIPPASADACMSAGMRSICTSPCAGRAAASARPSSSADIERAAKFPEKIFPRQV